MDSYLKDHWARGAWIVPIQGDLSVESCTSAIMLPSEDPAMPSISEARTTERREISWTRLAVTQFWEFLIAVQESCKLGPISLSLEVARPLSAGGVGEVAGDKPLSASLSTIDHFRVIVNMQYAMYVRTVLDAWSYKHQDAAKGDLPLTSKPGKVRLLKGATLLLVDNISRGLLIV
jgi:hypothetical protein